MELVRRSCDMKLSLRLGRQSLTRHSLAWPDIFQRETVQGPIAHLFQYGVTLLHPLHVPLHLHVALLQRLDALRQYSDLLKGMSSSEVASRGTFRKVGGDTGREGSDKQTERQANNHVGIRAGRQTGRQRDRQVGRWAQEEGEGL